MSDYADTPTEFSNAVATIHRLRDEQDALLAETKRLRQALAQILDEAGAYHGSPNRKTNALHAITVKARTALDGKPSAAQTPEDASPTKEKAGS